VTNAKYAAFLAACPATSSQHPCCYWNATYEPPTGWPAAPGKENHPVVWVDWCDAYAYCKWAGKRLCGQIDGDANPYAEFGNATSSQWFNACSEGGTRSYPYGSTYSPTACNGSDSADAGVSATIEVGSASGCVGTYLLYDLSGNVWEWEDSCDQNDCRVRGGSFKSNPSTDTLGCGYGGAFKRDFLGDDIGFRCCGP
jgi:formylglycine-generating enzyme required for sulfatase activity